MKRSLLLGCGNSREKKITWEGNTEWAGELTTLDMDPNCGADIVMDYGVLQYGVRLPFDGETFDEIGAFDTLEHVGRQGDWRGFFTEFAEYHRVLKSGGLMYVIVPIGKDAYADPGHTRFFSVNHFGFLSQAFYERNLAQGTSCTDYRWFYKKDFDILYLDESGGHHIACVLRKA